LRDLLLLQHDGREIVNSDVRDELAKLAGAVSFHWIRAAVGKVDEISELLRRNIQKIIALDALILDLRRS
jgi:DNA polymerase-3 subunit delta'